MEPETKKQRTTITIDNDSKMEGKLYSFFLYTKTHFFIFFSFS